MINQEEIIMLIKKLELKKQQVICGIIIEMNQVILFKYKTSIQGNSYNIGAGKEGCDANKVGKNKTEVVIPLKHLSNFWKSLNIPLVNYDVDLISTWSKNCVLADMTVRAAQGDNPAIVAPTGLEFKITNTKLYVQVVTLSKEK